MTKAYENILFEERGAVAILTLNRPETLNALTFDMMDEVYEALQYVEETSAIRALILTSVGRGFCSGQDLRNRPSDSSDLVEAIMGCYFKAFQAIRTCRVPVIVAINGIAAGGGFSLALTGDILIAARSAKFIQIFSRIGLVPDLGSTYLLPQAIGRNRALKLMMTNDPLSAGEAQVLGMLNDCVPDEELMPTAIDLANRLAKGPTHTLMQTRALVDKDEEEAFERRFREELEVQAYVRGRPDAKEGIAAFLEKREARFTGE